MLSFFGLGFISLALSTTYQRLGRLGLIGTSCYYSVLRREAAETMVGTIGAIQRVFDALPNGKSCCQRSFNRQSTAFVMRGLWVRFPPLALSD